MVKKLLCGSLLVFCLTYLSAQTTTGNITADETWSGTVTITGDIVITGATLTIAPGAVIKFAASNDNIVFGSSSRINVTAYQGGAVQANGTSDNRITFTTTSALPSPGAWGKFHIVNGAAASSFTYCDFTYQNNGITIENVTGNTDTTAVTVTIDNCSFKNGGSTAIFGGNYNIINISNTSIIDCKKGLFFNNTGPLDISYVTMANISTGIILAGGAYTAMTATVDHMTMYNVDMMLETNPQWWTGYGIFCTNTAYSLTLTNSILVQSTLANLIANSWTVTENNNCFYTGLLGLMNYEDGTPDATDIVGDFATPVSPLFVDAANDDFRLLTGSPCLDAGSDGKNMGSYDGPGIADGISDGLTTAPATLSLPNPVTAATVVPVTGTMDVYNTAGERVATYAGGTLRGTDLQPGLYHYTVSAGAAVHNGTFLLTR